MSVTFSACYNCLDRYVGCHSKCEKYIETKAKHDLESKRIREMKLVSEGGFMYAEKQMKKNNRSKRVMRYYDN